MLAIKDYKMAFIKLISIFLFIYFSSYCCNAADSSGACFERIGNAELPFEIYHERIYGCSKFIQPFESKFGLSGSGTPFIKCADETTVSPLCNGTFIAVWKFSHHSHPISLTGRIIDNKFNVKREDILISDNSKLEEWEHSVSTLFDGGFVVTWKTWRTNSRKEIKLRGRIFDISGNPLGPSFDVSYSNGNNNGGFVYGLPDGKFVVVWHNSRAGALLRIFDKNGKPQTKEILIASDLVDKFNKDFRCMLKPRAYITKDGGINVFMTCQSQRYVERIFFKLARSFNETGNPTSSILEGEDIRSLEGYRELLERYVKERASYYELRLREFNEEFKERRYCHGDLPGPHGALELKTFTNDQRMKNFFADFCAEYKNKCVIQEFEKKYLEQCLQE